MNRNKGKDKTIDKEIEKLEKEKDFVKNVLREKTVKTKKDNKKWVNKPWR